MCFENFKTGFLTFMPDRFYKELLEEWRPWNKTFLNIWNSFAFINLSENIFNIQKSQK